MARTATREDKFWAEYLGIEPTEWAMPGVSIRSHVGLLGYQGIWCFRRNGRTVVSAPQPWIQPITQRLGTFDPNSLLEPESWAQALGADFQKSIGPAFHGRLMQLSSSDAAQVNVRPIDDPDGRAIERFRLDCGVTDWESSGLARAERWRHAYFDGARITAMAGYRPWREDAGDVCILTHPSFRGGGRAAAVARAIIVQALANDQLVLFQTLEDNHAAVRLALSLGFQRYAAHLAIRLTRETPDP